MVLSLGAHGLSCTSAVLQISSSSSWFPYFHSFLAFLPMGVSSDLQTPLLHFIRPPTSAAEASSIKMLTCTPRNSPSDIMLHLIKATKVSTKTTVVTRLSFSAVHQPENTTNTTRLLGRNHTVFLRLKSKCIYMSAALVLHSL